MPPRPVTGIALLLYFFFIQLRIENESNQFPPLEMNLNKAKEVFLAKFNPKMFYNDNGPYF
jgi:hypothetical protein